MEEAAQILEVETFIPVPLMLQNTEDGVSHLKRVILIGDHYQVIMWLYWPTDITKYFVVASGH